MKKISLILAAFALVLGISQCRKQETPMGKLVTQDVTFTSSFNNGAKFGVDNTTDPAALKLTWDAGDIIIVTDDANPANESTLTCTEVSENGKSGTFTGTITCQEGANLTFSYNPIDYLNQDGSLQIYLKGTSPYQESGIYTVNMTMPCAVLKLNVSALGTSGLLTIAAGRGTVASVANVSGIASSVFVAVLANEAPTEYTISCGGKIAKEPWTLEANTFYTKDDGSGDGTGDAIVLEPYSSPELLPGKFSISATKYVQFSRGNLKATRSSSSSDDWKLGFFANQYEYGTYSTGNVFTVNDTEMSLFTFGFDTKESSFNPIGQTSGSEDWGNEYNRQYSLPSGTWQTLTGGPDGEWWYLLDGRPNAANLKVFKTVHGISNCLIIFPDIFDLSDIPSSTELTDDQWSDLEAKGAVCLPQAGIRVMSTYGTSSNGYWANNSYGQSNAYGAFFSGSTVASQGGGCSNYGYSIRLVQKFFKPHEYVDLDLPNGTLWATCNVGADSPKEYGDYFQWGGVTPVTSTSIYVSWATCPGNGGYGTYNESVFNTWKAENLTDDILEPTVDAACVNWGGDWRMPTSDDFKELCDNTYNQWIEENGVKGWKFTSKINSGKHIFLPAAGSRYDYQIYDKDTNGLYWSSSLYSSEPDKAYYLSFGSSTDANPQNFDGRGGGCPVRPVRAAR